MVPKQPSWIKQNIEYNVPEYKCSYSFFSSVLRTPPAVVVYIIIIITSLFLIFSPFSLSSLFGYYYIIGLDCEADPSQRACRIRKYLLLRLPGKKVWKMFLHSVNNAIKRTTIRSFATSASPRQVVVVDGVRTPFKRSSTDFDNLKAYDLGRIAIKGLMDKTALKPSDIDYVSFGTVIQEVKTHNLARECALGAGLLKTTPAHTVSMACISSNQAITTAAEKILSGRADVVLAGGAETMSDAPIRYNEKMRKRLIGAGKAMKKGPVGMVNHFSKGFSVKELVPEAPAVANFITGEVMGHSADRLAAKFGISREQQDEFAKKSHDSAAAAHAEGLLKSQIVPVNGNSEDNGVRGGTSMEDYSKLKPAFIKPHGTITAANASFMSDGASCSLIMSNTKAEEMGMKLAVLKDWNYHARRPFRRIVTCSCVLHR